ncbi:hypothetical protein M9Y10_021767 [Tritrichomonas musculus]|uniref:Leucine Rich Repeat family protein n=1 Tax=Tritrichomonas musculus TaxID=1915356 RepID=A0ABR2KQE9_9EUKA
MNGNNLRDLHIPPSTSLNISGYQLSSLVGLPSPEIIKTLQASNNNLEKIEEEQLQRCKSISNLDLSHNKIKKIENLFYLHHLHVLNLSYNLISVIENLEGDVNLRQLYLAENAITTIFIRSPLPHLVLLDVSGNKLRRLTGINSFRCLSTLIIERCLLTSLNGLQNLLNLRKISAASNQITDFQPFSLPLLSHIDLQNNRITSLSSFTMFQSLVFLDLSGNPIDDNGLGITVQLPELKEFKANGSNISDPSFVSSIAPNVVSISLLFCKISSVKNIQLLTNSAAKLIYLDLRGNPVNEQIYPDIGNKQYGSDSLSEYDSEELYDSKYPDSADIRKKYRKMVLSNAKSEIAYLDGIKTPGKGEKGILPPSKINFQYIDVQSDFESSVSNQQQSIQCDLSDSFESEDSLLCSCGMQTDPKRKPPNYQYPPTRKIFATDSTSESPASPSLRNINENNNLYPPTPEDNNEYDDEYNVQDSSEIINSPPKNAVPGRYSNTNSTSPTSDSAPYDIDLNRLGVNGIQPPYDNDAGNGIYNYSDDSCDDFCGNFVGKNRGNICVNFGDDFTDDFDKCSAATDLDSELFCPVGEEQPDYQGQVRYGAHRHCTDGCRQEIHKKSGGCAFWVDIDTKPAKPTRRRNIPPFNNHLYLDPKREISGGHYPFNTKSPRRLPWDNEPEKPPTPVWVKKNNIQRKRKTKKSA